MGLFLGERCDGMHKKDFESIRVPRHLLWMTSSHRHFPNESLSGWLSNRDLTSSPFVFSTLVIRSKANTKHRWTWWPTCFSVSCSRKDLQWFGAAVEQEVEWSSTNHPQPLQSTCRRVLGEGTELQIVPNDFHWCVSVYEWFFASDEHMALWIIASAIPVFECVNNDL